MKEFKEDVIFILKALFHTVTAGLFIKQKKNKKEMEALKKRKKALKNNYFKN